MMQIGSINNLGNGRITNTTCRIVDDATQCLLVVWVSHNTEVGNDILDFLTLVETQSTIDTIWNAVLAHLFLKRTTLRIGTIENGEIAILGTLLPTNALDVITHDDGLFLITIGRL